MFVLQPTAMPPVLDWHLVAERRINLLSAACKNTTFGNLTHISISKFVLDRIFVCDKHKILFCQTPKVGNTQWKKVLIVLNGKEGRDNYVHIYNQTYFVYKTLMLHAHNLSVECNICTTSVILVMRTYGSKAKCMTFAVYIFYYY